MFSTTYYAKVREKVSSFVISLYNRNVEMYVSKEGIYHVNSIRNWFPSIISILNIIKLHKLIVSAGVLLLRDSRFSFTLNDVTLQKRGFFYVIERNKLPRAY